MYEPTVENIERHPGIAGQYTMTADVTYPDGPTEPITFVGSIYGGPVVMVTPSGQQVMVSQAVTERLGSTLDESWVRRFFL
jgi:hypothetical protein